jgi:hypothetical protein
MNGHGGSFDSAAYFRCENRPLCAIICAAHHANEGHYVHNGIDQASGMARLTDYLLQRTAQRREIGGAV